MPLYKVEYYAATYNGTKFVFAESKSEACDKVKAWVRKLMTLPMYTDGYKATLESQGEDENEENDY